MRVKSFVRLTEDDAARYTRRRIGEMLGGLEGLGTQPDPETFPPSRDEAAIVDPVLRAYAVGQRIVNRLTNTGEYHDQAFLLVARIWVQSVHDALVDRAPTWRAMLAGPDADRIAGDLAANDEANARRVVEVLDVIDEALILVRVHQAAGDADTLGLRAAFADAEVTP